MARNSSNYTYTLADAISGFNVISLSAQAVGAAIGDDIISNAGNDTLILSAGPNIALISDPTTDTITISAQAGGGGGSSDLSEVAAASGDWNGTHTTVNGNSGNWDTTYTRVASAHHSWDKTHTTLYANSAGWNVGTSSLVTVGTIGTGTWQGTAVALGYGGTGLVGATDGKIVIADGSGAPVHLDVGSSTAITILGTVATGTWQGTAIAQAYIANDAINGDKIADDAVDSEHYTDGSIDTAHIADDQVTLAKMAGITRGSIIIGNASGNPAALAIGTNDYVLTSDGTDIAWEAAAGGGGGGGAIDISGTPANNQLAIWTDADTLEGDSDLTFNGSTLEISTPGTGDALKLGRKSGSSSIKSTVTHLLVDSAGGYIGLNDIVTDDVVLVYGGGSGGNVGIGVTAPAAKLDIAEPATGDTLKLGRKSGQSSIKSTATHLLVDSAGGYIGLNDRVTDDVVLAAGGGDVGIGTSTPGSKLTVAGAISAQGTVTVGNYTLPIADGSNTYVLTTNGNGTVAWTAQTDTNTTYTAGDGLTLNSTDFDIDAAQTTITSILAADVKIGEDDQTKIDFETADEIHFYAANVEQVYLGDNIFGPQSDSDVDLGSSSVRWKDAYLDTVTSTGNVVTTGVLSATNAAGSSYGSSPHWTYVADNSAGKINYTTEDIYTTISSDSDYGDVVCMLHFEGSNGATDTSDESLIRRTVNFEGTAQISTAQKKYGSSSLLLDGNSDHVSLSAEGKDHSLDPGTSDFTIECWFYYDQATASQYATIFDRGNGEGNGFSPFWLAVLDDSGIKLVATCGTGGGQTNVINHYDLAAITNNTWYHVALVRDGDDFYIYLNGASLANAEASDSGALTDNGAPVLIGARGQYSSAGYGVGSWWGGYIDEFRMTVGTCRYPGGTSFTPSVSAFSGETNVQTVVTSLTGYATSTTGWVLEDDDGTEVTVSDADEVKFIGSGITTNWTDTSTGSDGDPYDLTLTVDAAQTGITSLLATDIKIGEDDQTKIDFETANEIHFYANNVEQVYLADNIFGPQSDSDVDLGTTGVRWKDAFVDSITTTGDIDCGGEVQTANIGYTDGDNAMTIADGGKVTFAAGFAVGSDAAGDILYHNGTSYVRLAKGTADQVLTMNDGATAPGWEAASGGGGSGTITALNNQAENRLVSIGSTTTQLDGEANLTFTGSLLTVGGSVSASGGFSSAVRPITTLTSNGVVTYDIAGPALQTIILKANQANTYLGTESLPIGKTVTVRLSANGANRTLGWHTSMNFVGEKPASIARDKIALLSITTFGTLCGVDGVDTDVVCAYAVED